VHDSLLNAAPQARLAHGALPTLPLVREYRESIHLMERWIAMQYVQRPLRILEAGCGNKWPLKLTVPYALTAVDIDVNALEIRKSKVRDIDEVIVGDLRTSDLVPEGSFDVVYNSFVLEHVQGAEQVLDNLFRWLAPGGLLILRIPDRDTVYGFLTRITPFWSHVALKRYVYRMPNAGKPGYDPYPTFSEPVVARKAIHSYCRKHGHVVDDEIGHGDYLPRNPPLNLLGNVVVRSLAQLSLGKLEWRYNNVTFFIHKNGGAPSAGGSAAVPREKAREKE
jgi:SAM-dependent methyltransferase